jgi:hypothetical protein
MDPILVDVTQLRALQLPAINLTLGRVIAARVIEADLAGRGLLSIAGARIAASLPPGVHSGDELRLVVREVSPERVVLGLEPPPQPPQEGVAEREAHAGRRGAPTSSLALRYDTPSLGPMDLRFDLYAGDALSVTVSLEGEGNQALARAHASELQSALARALGSAVGVTVTGPRPPLDTYA